VAWKLDRISRNALDTLQLLEWLDQRGKYLIAVSDGIDTRLPMGRLFVQLAAIFAELERTFIRERILSSRAALRDQGRYGGEGIPYGLMSVRRDDGPGYALQQDSIAVPAIHRVVKMLKDGKRLADAQRWLDSTGVLSPRERQRELYGKTLKGEKWNTTSLSRTLRKRDLVEHGILSPAEYRELQAVLDRLSRPKERGGNNPAPLSGVAVCPDCLQPLWHRAQHMPAGKNGQKTTKTYRYYYCKTTGHTRQMPAEEVENAAETVFLAVFADVPVTERVEVPATDHGDEIAAAQMAIEDLARALASARSEAARSALSRELSALDERLAELESIPGDPGGVRWVPTGRTWAEELEDLNAEDRRELWKRVGFRFAVRKTVDGWRMGWRLPAGWREAMPEIAKMHDQVVAAGDPFERVFTLDTTTGKLIAD
jgi:hypothetical protein